MALTYSIVGGPDAGKFNIDATTGVLTFKTPPDFENPGSSAGTNDYRVTVGATDPAAAMTTQDRVITVTDVNEAPPNQPPVFTSPADVSVPENQTAVDAVQATDPDAPPLQPTGWPDAMTTGVRAGVTLVGNGSGVINSNAANQVISGRHVDTIVVDHPGVTVVDSRCRNIDFLSNADGSKAEYCDIIGRGTGGNSVIDVLGANNVTVSRCDISGFGNGTWLEASGYQFLDNYLHAPFGSADEHFDGIQVPEGTNARNCVVRGNNFALGGRSSPPVSGMSSCMTLSSVHGMLIDANRIDGGTYCIYFEHDSSGCNLTNNDFVSHHNWAQQPNGDIASGNWIDGQASGNGHTFTDNTFGGVLWDSGHP